MTSTPQIRRQVRLVECMLSAAEHSTSPGKTFASGGPNPERRLETEAALRGLGL